MTKEEIIALIKREVIPAMGCTEPMAVSLCTAMAAEDLGVQPEEIDVLLSANILKNAMGVGIPGTGMVGLPIAVALGALIGKSDYQLEVLRDVTPDDVQRGKTFIDEGRIHIALKENIPEVMGYDEKLYIEVTCRAAGKSATAIIAKEHTHRISPSELRQASNEVPISQAASSVPLADRQPSHEGASSAPCADHQPSPEGASSFSCADHHSTHGSSCDLTLRQVYDFAMQTPLEELAFINEARRLNEQAASEALKGNYGHCLGKTLSRPLGRGIMGESIFSHILSKTSAACDARMAGAKIPVMSNSGSGNQGIAATLPVVVFAEENHNTEEELIRALILSHLTAIYIKQSLGRLSALCGCVVASTGSSCGMTYLMGGGYEQVSYSVKNMIANLAGMVCDGAKPSCALKVTSGVSTAILSALLAVQNNFVGSVEGLIEDDVDRCIHNLTRLGADGMVETDRMVLDIMTHKQ